MASVCILGASVPGLDAALAARALTVVHRDSSRASVVLRTDPALNRPLGLPTLTLVAGPTAAVDALERVDDSDFAHEIVHSAGATEIAARLAALLRRCRLPATLHIADLSIDPVERRVARAGRPIALLPREYALLLYLARRAGRTIDRDELHRSVLGIAFDPGTNVLAVHVSRLRAKIDRGFPISLIVTEKGRGYRLTATDR